MTLNEFKKQITIETFLGKYVWYLFYLILSGVGLFLLYDVFTNTTKYSKHDTFWFAFFSYLAFTFVGIYGVFIIPNRYRTRLICSTLPLDKKKEIVNILLKKFGDPVCYKSDSFFSFKYRKKWWASAYIVYLGINSDNFYLNVQSIVGGYYSGGIIDFGHTEKMRQNIILTVNTLLKSR